ncbi:hook-length control protein FliK [Thiohalospira halophila DSM 15071]|uniref:Hook-length control protein FliK n=1 Tax=Thiohalospira halophila DSM 15071 TaxID=1123397 RepID=A0A1I1PEQ4_9GAMM|nr:flagellar hook-length control protein FliK [Thiohalospira halophila]SFD08277.1 hook-length control protein FliK [Thiohalospira halophila DSM 15071]
MEIQRPDTRPGTGQTLTLRQASSETGRSNWQTGQLLRATVTSFTADGRVNLRVDNTPMQSNQPAGGLRAQPGQSLQMQVVQGGKQPVLQVLQGPAQPDQIARAAAREALPRQQPLDQALQRVAGQLRSLAEQSGQTETGRAARQVLNSLPGGERLSSSEGFRQALANSGQFLENKLGRQAAGGGTDGTALSRDLKGALLRLLTNLRSAGTQTGSAPARGGPPAGGGNPSAANPTPANPPATGYTARGQAVGGGNPATASGAAPAGGTTAAAAASSLAGEAAARGADLARNLEAGLARIQLNQVGSTAGSESQRPTWQLELPFRGPDGEVQSLAVRIENERQGDGESVAPLWTVNLRFELERLGAIRAGITLVGGAHVSVGLWAEEPETVALFEEHLEELRTRMAEAGLTVGHVGVRQGEAPAPGPGTDDLDGPLVDEEA